MTYGRFVSEVIHPDDRAGVEAALSRALASGGTYEATYRACRRRPEGGWDTRWIVGRGSRTLRPDGSPGHVLGVAWDVTERQEAEARLRELQAELLRVSRLSAAGEIGRASCRERV